MQTLDMVGDRCSHATVRARSVLGSSLRLWVRAVLMGAVESGTVGWAAMVVLFEPEETSGITVELPVLPSARIFSTACSATETISALGLVVTISGKIDASTTNRLSMPYTLVFRSTTAVPFLRPESAPILQEPIQWLELRVPVV